MMQNNDELLTNLVGKQKECEFSLRFLLQKEEGSWKNFFTMLKLVKKGTRKEINYDYEEYVLGEKLLGIPDGLKARAFLVSIQETVKRESWCLLAMMSLEYLL